MQEILSKQPPQTGARIFLVNTPYNDWSSVSQAFHAHKPDISADGTRRTFTEMVPGSFFEQCLPDASVDVANRLVLSALAFRELSPSGRHTS